MRRPKNKMKKIIERIGDYEKREVWSTQRLALFYWKKKEGRKVGPGMLPGDITYAKQNIGCRKWSSKGGFWDLWKTEEGPNIVILNRALVTSIKVLLSRPNKRWE